MCRFSEIVHEFIQDLCLSTKKLIVRSVIQTSLLYSFSAKMHHSCKHSFDDTDTPVVYIAAE